MDVPLFEVKTPVQYFPTINALATGGINLRRSTAASEIKNKVNVNRIINRAILEKNALILTTDHHLSDRRLIIRLIALPPIRFCVAPLFKMKHQADLQGACRR